MINQRYPVYGNHPCHRHGTHPTGKGTSPDGHHSWPIVALTVTFALLAINTSMAAEPRPDRVRVDAGIRHTWDDNYNRRPGQSQEQITVATAGVAVRTDISQQSLAAGAGLAHYQHHSRDFLDTTTHRAHASWAGQIGPRVRHRIGWSRYERPEDRTEFTGKDIVTMDNRSASLTLGTGTGWQLPASIRQERRSHSNAGQQALNHDDLRVSTGLRYITGKRSSVTLEVARGEREYPQQGLNRPEDLPPAADLDYEYTEVAVRTRWPVTSKTRLDAHVGHFRRDGEANDGTGIQTGLDLQWRATHKLTVESGYHFDQPPIGETSNSPSDLHRLYLETSWQATPRLQLGTRISHGNFRFESRPDRPGRTEKVYRWSPLNARYQFSDQLGLTLASGWLKRDSPREDRNFVARDLTLGLELQF